MNRSIPLILKCLLLIIWLSIGTRSPIALAGVMANEGATLNINIVGDGNISTSPSDTIFTLGDDVSIAATPNAGWSFSGWSGDLLSTAPWWDSNWRYRTVICVHANGYDRTDKPVDVDIDFTQLLQAASKVGVLDLDSLRVIEVDSFGNVINSNVPFQFDQSDTFDAASNASGTLIFMMSGSTIAAEERLFHLYFDTTNSGTVFAPASVASQVILTQSVLDESMDSFQFTNQNASYYLQKRAGGFSSMVDQDGNDWIGYSSANGSAGEFRGIPNLIYPESQFHPGANNSISTIIRSGPLKVTAATETTDSAWKAIWEIYPTYATMTVLTADHNYWFLYEGAPGGELDYDDEIYLSNTSSPYSAISSADPIWGGDLSSEEWGYAADPNVGANGRSIFLAHHEDDAAKDWYASIGAPPNAMTILGFGRDGIDTKISNTPQHFTIGLMDEISYASASTIIRSAYKDLTVTIGALEAQADAFTYTPGVSSPFTISMNMSRNITATFVPEYYTIDTQTTGNGSIGISSSASPLGYTLGEAITLTAIPDVGWSFVGWSGDGTGTANPLVTTVAGNGVFTATFAQSIHELNLVQPIAGGSIEAMPNSSTYAYGTSVQLKAISDSGYQFDGWTGDFAGTAPTAPTVSLLITGDMTISAEFSLIPYSLSVNSAGAGQITVMPNQTEYYYDDQVSISAMAQPGWQFGGWSGDLSDQNPTSNLMIRKDTTITGTFIQNQYTLTTSVTGSGNISSDPEQASYTYNDVVTLTASPEPHWDFVGWSGDISNDVSAADTSIAVAMTDDKAIHANYEPHLYGISVAVVGDGTTMNSPAQSGYTFGDTMTLNATPNSGWRFAGWSGDHTDNNASSALTISGNMEIVATFETISYALADSVNGNGAISRQPDLPQYDYGDSVEVTAVPLPGWRFIGWSGVASGTSRSTAVTVSGNNTVVATFEQERYTVQINNVGSGMLNVTPQQTAYTYGDVINFSAVADDGWHFAGWQGNLGGMQASQQMTVTGNSIITGTFDASPYRLITNVIGNGQVETQPNRSSYAADERVSIVAIPDVGWRFLGWGGDLVSANAAESLTVVANHSLTATFAPEAGNGGQPGGSTPTFLYLPAIMPAR